MLALQVATQAVDVATGAKLASHRIGEDCLHLGVRQQLARIVGLRPKLATSELPGNPGTNGFWASPLESTALNRNGLSSCSGRSSSHSFSSFCHVVKNPSVRRASLITSANGRGRSGCRSSTAGRCAASPGGGQQGCDQASAGQASSGCSYFMRQVQRRTQSGRAWRRSP